MRVPSGTGIADEDDTSEEDDSGVSLNEDSPLKDELVPVLEDELSWDSEDSSIELPAEVEELSSPHAANSNAEEIKKGRIFL
jgi:hypothetical protein